MGAPLLRNLLAAVCLGMNADLLTPSVIDRLRAAGESPPAGVPQMPACTAVLPLRPHHSIAHHPPTLLLPAGWEPLLRQIQQDTTYQGHYRPYFLACSAVLLAALRSWGGTAAELAALSANLRALMPLAVPPRSGEHFRGQPLQSHSSNMPPRMEMPASWPAPAALPAQPRCSASPTSSTAWCLPKQTLAASAPRIKALHAAVPCLNCPLVLQVEGPDGSTLTIVQATHVTRDYTKQCAACGVGEGEPGVRLQACGGCRRRVRYCSKQCQVRVWALWLFPRAASAASLRRRCHH